MRAKPFQLFYNTFMTNSTALLASQNDAVAARDLQNSTRCEVLMKLYVCEYLKIPIYNIAQ